MTVNTASMCKQQEAIHRDAAAATPLANVRKIELRAAAAWEKQAQEAVQKESGGGNWLSPEDAAIALEFLLEEESDLLDEVEPAYRPEPATSHDIA